MDEEHSSGTGELQASQQTDIQQRSEPNTDGDCSAAHTQREEGSTDTTASNVPKQRSTQQGSEPSTDDGHSSSHSQHEEGLTGTAVPSGMAGSVDIEPTECRNRYDGVGTAQTSNSFVETVGENLQSPELAGACGDCDRDYQTSSYHQDLRSETAFPECIVCQSRPLNCVLLPCRHTSVCSVCFQKLDRCPMCRSHVESFFTLRDDDDDTPSSADAEPVPMDLYSRFERFNTRLNQYLGFD